MAYGAERYEGADGQTYRVFRTGKSDTSRVVMNGTEYDSRCNSCWLNHAHSENLHTANIGTLEVR